MYCYMLSDYLKAEFGEKIYKLTLSAGMTCPNRDGTCGDRGCIFCSRGGSGEFAQSALLPVSEQIGRAKAQLSKKTSSGKYIAYFQPYSNTYESYEYLKELYTPVVLREDVAILSIATRPDCINNKTIELISELNSIKPVWVELGLQTIHQSTSDYIRRGYPLSVYIDAVSMLKKAGVKVITHLILGLPGETKQDMIESAKFAGELSDGIKFHMLYVLSDTDLADEYLSGKFKMITRDEYIDTLCDCIRYIPKNVVIHRITGDAEKESLIAPKWSLDKVKLLREIHNAFYDKNVIQGEYLKNNKRHLS
ncbi:MAG: TIGR01212 family radical SAM protein [Clostridia bacterium]|nr:TIGR01212 family radical SAM protein [Clostridia bacterium]